MLEDAGAHLRPDKGPASLYKKGRGLADDAAELFEKGRKIVEEASAAGPSTSRNGDAWVRQKRTSMPQLEEQSRLPRAGALPPSVIWLMAGSVGAIVANIYYAQPLLGDIARTFGITVTGAGALAMLTQAGTALGQFSFVPLGDILERRRLMTILVSCAAVALAIISVAPTLLWLSIGSFLLGLTAASVHVIIPFAAHLAPEQSRGLVLGRVFSGLLLGILLARTFSGIVGAALGWRAVFAIACVMMLFCALLIRWRLPKSQPTSTLTWPKLIRSVVPMWGELPMWRDACFTSMLMFSTFSAFWTTLVFFLESPAYHYGSRVAGLFGLGKEPPTEPYAARPSVNTLR